MTRGHVLFDLDGRSFATDLGAVREIVRLAGLQRLPGSRPPLVGMLVVRGVPLPVLDARGADLGGSVGDAGDVLVLDAGSESVGIAVDGVREVLAAGELTAAGPVPGQLPSYVVGVAHRGDAPVLVVDLHALVGSVGAPAQT
jgi:purine-binding chemotaxis protein CheW